MLITVENRFALMCALRNAIKTFEMFEDRHCANVRCSDCIFRYQIKGIDEILFACPNDELSIGYDIKVLKELLEELEK